MAAAKRPRIKGKFVETVPDFISVIKDGRQGLEETETTSAEDVKTTPKSHRSSKRVASTSKANRVSQEDDSAKRSTKKLVYVGGAFEVP